MISLKTTPQGCNLLLVGVLCALGAPVAVSKSVSSSAKRPDARTALQSESSHTGCKAKRADGDVIQTLMARARQQGTVRIIVGLCVDFIPEGNLNSEREKRQQRNVIKQTQNALLKKMSKFKATGVKKYEYIPFLAMQVDAAALKFLSGSSLVSSIEEDKIMSVAPSAFNLNPALEQNEPGSIPHEQTSPISHFGLGPDHWPYSSDPTFTS